MKKIAILVVSSLITTHYTHAQRALKEEDLSYNLPKKTTKFELANQLFELKDTAVISPNAVYVQEMVSHEYANFYKRETAFYRKDYTKLYKWL